MIALSPTDRNWFHFLRKQPDISIVNFWTPTDWNIHNLSQGDYWYFVLKGSEPRKIGGGGRFIEYKFMRASKAWELYGFGNGAASYQEMVDWLNEYISKRALASKPSSDPEIGCVILDNCIFVADHQQKTSLEFGLTFPKEVVKFKTFNHPPLQLTKVATKQINISDDEDDLIPPDEEDARKRIKASIVRRQGQPQFRQSLLTEYEGKCAITGCDVSDALEAAHITPYMGEQTNTVQNGLLLRADIHTLFDLGKIAISPNDFRIILHRDLRDGHYGTFHLKMISVPKNKSSWPSIYALEKHKKDSGL